VPNPTIKLASLEQLLVAPTDRLLAEACLTTLREVVPGDHFSAILFNTKAHKVEDYFLDEGWLASNNAFWQAAQKRLIDHPLAESFLSRQHPISLVRSRMIPDAVWKKTWLYNEVERPLKVEDIGTIFGTTPSGNVMILSCGRSRRFSERDLSSLQNYHRVFRALVPFRACNPRPRPPQTSPLSALTAREHEILHWVREGKRDPEIAIILAISPRTVNHHLASIYRKLGVETRTAAAFIH
jgi:DNA-binding CsgD family transcriptional regulator